MTTQYVAFLRGINVGGRTVKKAELCAPFEALGLGGVTTFIASGNVIFDTGDRAKAPKPAALEADLERELKRALRFDVATFVRSLPEIAAIAGHRPFGPDEPKDGTSLFVLLLKNAPTAAVRKALHELDNDIDAFETEGREVYWLARHGLAKSTIKDNVLAKALGKVDTTNRNMNTLQRLAEKYPAERS